MEQMAASSPDKYRVETGRKIHRGDADDHGILELVGSREDDGRHVGDQLEEVLE